MYLALLIQLYHFLSKLLNISVCTVKGLFKRALPNFDNHFDIQLNLIDPNTVYSNYSVFRIDLSGPVFILFISTKN